jgi:hypothetical protein
LCLPFEHPAPAVGKGRIADNAFQFNSPSADFQSLGAFLLRPEQVTDLPASGPVSAIVALPVGFGSNYLQAIRAEGRLVLNNASHRAYALRDMGVTHAPCLIQQVSRRDELAAIAHLELQAKPDLFLKEPRPPVLKDYFDPMLRKLLPLVRRQRQIRIAFQIEPLDVPVG